MHKWIKYLRSHGQQTTEKLIGQRHTFARLIPSASVSFG